MKELLSQIENNAKELESILCIKKSSIFGKQLTLDASANNALEKLLKNFQQQISMLTTSEMRGNSDHDALKSCESLAKLSIDLLKSQSISNRLKTAIFNKFNLAGFLIDRSEGNFRQCCTVLKGFYQELDGYKQCLTPDELDIWNSSTYGGREQAKMFFDYLENHNINC